MAKKMTRHQQHQRVIDALATLKRNGLTQIQIATEIGCSQSQISQMKQGYNITPAMLEKLEALEKEKGRR